MRAFLDRNLMEIMMLTSVALGFLLPDIGVHWKQYVAYLLMLMLFSTILTVEPDKVMESARNVRSLGYALAMVLVLGPALALTGKSLFSPSTFVGIMLALSAPSAVSAAFFSSKFEGDTAYALVITIVTHLLVILTIPLTMFLTLGAIISLDLSSMFLDLVKLILVPTALAFLVSKTIHIDQKRISRYVSKTNLVLLSLIIWGSMSSGATYTRDNPLQFLWLTLFIIALLVIVFAVAFKSCEKHGRKQAITVGIAAIARNGALPFVIATTLFSSETLPPLVANIVAQNLLLVTLGTLLRKMKFIEVERNDPNALVK